MSVIKIFMQLLYTKLFMSTALEMTVGCIDKFSSYAMTPEIIIRRFRELAS